MPWESIRENGIFHVIPLDDLKPHQESETCFCRPLRTIEPETLDVCFVHHALDGREFSEPDFDPAFSEVPN